MYDTRPPYLPATPVLDALPRSSGRRLVVGDVHGCLRTLSALLDRLALTRSDQVFLLGDYVNKGPHSAQVIELLEELMGDGYALFPLRGNHEQMWLQAAQAGPQACLDLAERQQAEDLLDAADSLTPRYRAFMEACPFFARLEDALLVHGGFDFSSADPFHPVAEMLTIRDYPVDEGATGGRRIYHGHQPTTLTEIQAALANGAPHVSLDNGCVYYGEREDLGRLLAYDLDSHTLIAQSFVEHLQIRPFTPAPSASSNGTPAASLILDHLVQVARLGETLEHRFELERRRADATYQDSLVNLLHYIALRRHDLRPIQDQLGALGMSRLGRCEAHVRASLGAVAGHVARLAGQTSPIPTTAPPVSISRGRTLLEDHAEALLGPAAQGRRVRIMVTLPTEAATQPALVHDLIARGADAVRINAAHDTPKHWEQMVAHVRAADQVLGKRTYICMDLAGPKLRTGPLAPGPEVLRLRRQRDAEGRTTGPYPLQLAAPHAEVAPEHGPHVPVPAAALRGFRPGDTLHFRDTRGKKRRWTITGVEPGRVLATGLKTTYLRSGTPLKHRREGSTKRTLRVGALPPKEQPLRLRPGDTLVLHRRDEPGGPAQRDDQGEVVQPAHVSCTLPAVYTDVRPGEPILFDDGRLEGTIEHTSQAELVVKITYAKGGVAPLRGHKGINLPESRLRLRGLTTADRSALAFAVQHVDVVNLSFVNDVEDVHDLYDALAALEAPASLGVILKIETRRGVQNLPTLLLAAMRRAPLGVMIARGDLAVECGWQHLAQVQEELLRVCEAAHVPIVWATQVLETAAKTGRPSRAEVTDAAMAQRAEAVMLNKGPYIGETVSMLDEILVAMRQFRQKKAPMLPALQLPAGLVD
ncbi:MAG: pyruvate kinase [Bacteroidota bacterium]